MNAWVSKADLVYKGPTTADYDQNSYKSENLGNNPETDSLKELISFMLDLQSFDAANTPDSVGYWNSTRLDLDGFLRNMACEYLMGAFDTYWYSGSNYFMYKNPSLLSPRVNGNGCQSISITPLGVVTPSRLLLLTRTTRISRSGARDLWSKS